MPISPEKIKYKEERMKIKTTDTLPNGCIMTLKDVVDTINVARMKNGNESILRHDRAIRAIKKLSQTPSFGEVDNLSTFNLNGTEVKTLALTKKQAIASAAKLDNTMLMQVIDRVEELENKSNAVLLDSREYDLKCKKLEAEELLLREEISDRRVQRVKLLQEMGCNFDPITLINNGECTSVLDKGTSEALTDAYSDIRTGAKVFSATSLLSENNVGVRTKDFNDAMIQANLMEKYIYKNTTYKKFTSNVNYYGYNRDASSIKVNPVQPMYYEDRFLELVQLLNNQGYID